MSSKIHHIINNFKLWKQYNNNHRDNRIILFGSWFGERYADTSRYLFQYLSDHKEAYSLSHVVWVTRSNEVKAEIQQLGYEVFLIDSEESIAYHKIAGIHIICNMSEESSGCKSDIIGYYSYGAKKVNLWHGVMPMKGVANASNEYKRKKQDHPFFYSVQEFLIKHSKLFRSFYGAAGAWGNCYYLSVTPAGTELLTKFFSLPHDHYIETGNPRVCGSVTYTNREKSFFKVLKQYKKIILYLPTFRDQNSSFDYSHVAEPLQQFLDAENAVWVQKSHSAASSATYAYQQEGNIIYLSSDFDTNTIMDSITLLVTDFSSVAADAMFFLKPIIYYMPDYDEYLSQDRGFVIDPNSVMMGKKVINLEELKNELKYQLNNSFDPDQKYKDTRFKYWGPNKTMDEIWNDIIQAVRL